MIKVVETAFLWWYAADSTIPLCNNRVKSRLVEERRDRLAQNIKEAKQEYERGAIRRGSVDDLMREISE